MATAGNIKISEETVSKLWDEAAEKVLENNPELWERLAEIGFSNNTSWEPEFPEWVCL